VTAEGIRVEPARRIDALPSLALQREVLAEDRWFVSRADELLVTLDQREAFVARAASSPTERFLVARLPDVRVAGWLQLDVVPLRRLMHVGRVEVLVAAPFRGMGVGKALLDAVIADARAGGVLRKLSLAVFADNPRAIAIYASCGFVEEGRRRGEVRMEDGTARDDVLMALHL
jgi:ribosomal protein S18 acetylase RimI-like enzyme